MSDSQNGPKMPVSVGFPFQPLNPSKGTCPQEKQGLLRVLQSLEITRNFQ